MAGLGLSIRMHGVFLLEEFSVMMVLILMIGNVQGFVADPNAQPVGPLCYSCLQVAHQRDCTHIVQCGPKEKCVGRKFITLDGLEYFSSGCATIAECGVHRSFKQDKSNTLSRSGPVIAGHDVIKTCDQCCDGNYCNLQLCDNPILLKQRCLRCDHVINPEDCNISLQCNEDQICYTEHIYLNQEKRFRMGCTPKSSCLATTSSGSQVGVLGKRDNELSFLHRYRMASPADRKYCAKCCTGENCNRDLCTERHLVNQYQLLVPPPLVICQDYDDTSCRSGLVDPTFCQDLVNRRLFCPRTCHTCGESGMLQPVTTAISTTAGGGISYLVAGTTTTAVACLEKNPGRCQQYKAFFCDPSNHGGMDACPVTCKAPGC
ncbi:uncharacterized protein LOC134255022 [Saccostrea cucullata]|uniref:uncharacterized protein LOC134255022 n=1 Tax=Saccostrea cuccullata TaxID=36930 RepID=UPI002ED6BA10